MSKYAIYKILPDRNLTWRNVMVGALLTHPLISCRQFSA
jgi:uncharacterized BrkB/YihY/UPF0761 family membrane protein